MPRACVLIRHEPYYRKAALEGGLKRLGYKLIDGRQSHLHMSFVPESRDDLLVVWNLKAGTEEDHAARFEARGGTVIVVENGYLQKVDKSIYALSAHGHNGSGWFPHDPDEDRFTRLGFPMRPWREQGNHILICDQRGIGSRRMRSPGEWGRSAESSLAARFMVPGGRGKLIRPIRYRAHPGNFMPAISIEKDLEYAWACAIWSSAAGVRALTLGIPVFYAAPTWICAAASTSLKRLDPDCQTPKFSPHTVREALNRMAHGQWTVDEIEHGEPFARMRAQGWGADTWS